MIYKLELALSPEEAASQAMIETAIKQHQALAMDDKVNWKIERRSIDARSKNIKIRLQLQVFINESPSPEENFKGLIDQLPIADQKKCAYIIGCGPAGLYAALTLLKYGVKPIIIEQGKNVKDRRRDLAAINKQGLVNPHSNYCFGEGGAGTYSDGKLYTRSGSRNENVAVLNWLVAHGANDQILIDAHPHIGTNKLPQIITAMRETIVAKGGEIWFNTVLEDIAHQQGKVVNITIRNLNTDADQIIVTNHLILATGHSAQNVFKMLHNRNILIQAKPFALGVRIEHPQLIIDQAQYHCIARSPYLPPASYALVHNTKSERGVYSFCMCPGGIIAPAATDTQQIVVNGWSQSKRNNPYANSGMVVTVDEREFAPFGADPLRGLRFQSAVEATAFDAGGGLLVAPAQRLVDFVQHKMSESLPDNSYMPGLRSVPLTEVLPSTVSAALRDGLLAFKSKMKGYYTNDAVLVATESRTSSPVRIPRDKNSLEHVTVAGLYPCAEGAGYAGGIVSAAIDGMKCAKLLAEKYFS
jgi:uncharacterized protein